MADYPIIDAFLFDIDEDSDPAGTRHIPGGSFAFQQKLALGNQPALGDPVTTSGVLTFEDVRFNVAVPVSHIESKVAAVVFHLNSDATTGAGTFISNMKLYLGSNTALTAGPFHDATEPAFVQYTTSGNWHPGALLPSGAGTRLTTSVPAVTNVRRQDGFMALQGVDDANVSQYVYMNAVVPLSYPLGKFGVSGSGMLTFNLLFDYFTI